MIKRSLVLGKDSDKCLVILTMEIKESDCINYETMQTKKMFTLSICGEARRGNDYPYCGQIYDTVMENLQYFDQVPKKNIERIVEIWKEYHLNDLTAGTKKQDEYIDNLKKNGTMPKYDYKLACKYLEDANLLVDNGYRYGTKWLCKPLPQEIIHELLTLF